MYKISNDLKNTGFSYTTISKIIERNGDSGKFCTLEFFVIFIVLADLHIIVEKKEHFIKAGHMVFIGPQINYEILSDNTITHVIAFAPDFYEKSSKDSLFLHSELFLNSEDGIVVTPFQNPDEMRLIFIERLKEFKEKDEGLYIAAAHNAIERLILDGFLHLPEKEAGKENRFEDISYINKFRILLQKDVVEHKKVSYYAEKLHVSPRKLSKMTEQTLGVTAKQLIINKIISEYGKIVKNGNLTFSQISYALGFSDESNFSNFIKKHTGKKPSESKMKNQLQK